MNSIKYIGAFSMTLAALAACAPESSNEIVEAPAEIMNSTAWFDNYNAGNADGVAALYAADATLMAPGVPAITGRTSIRDFVAADIENSKAAGLSFQSEPVSDGAASGNTAWINGNFSLQDADGTTVAAGKYLTVYEQRGADWLIVRDIWNMDAPMASEYDAQVTMLGQLIDAWDGHDADALDAIAASDYQRRAPDQNTGSLEEQKAFMNQVFAAYPDFAISNDGAAAGPAGAFVKWTVTGTNTGEGPQPPTGNAIELPGISYYEFRDGKIAREFVVFDSGELLEQLESTDMPHAAD